jgi:hypothetical protein
MSLSKNLEKKLAGEKAAAALRLRHLQFASMVSWFRVFSRVRDVSEEPEQSFTLPT